jgi:hypothetical protein
MNKLYLCLLFVIILQSMKAQYAITDTLIEHHDGNVDEDSKKIVKDSQGNFYLLGNHNYYYTTNGDVRIVKCNPAGDTLWTSIFNVPVNFTDYFETALVDKNDNLVIAGEFSQGSLSSSYHITNFVSKIDPAGVILWTDTFSNGQKYCTVKNIIADTAGNIYVSGTTALVTYDKNLLTYKLDASGAHLWAQTYTGVAGWDDLPVGFVKDAGENIYVTGTSKLTGSNTDVRMLKYDPSGNLIWNKSYDYNALAKNDDVMGTVEDSTNIYIYGTATIAASNMKPMLVKFDSAGNFKWVKTYIRASYSTRVPTASSLYKDHNNDFLFTVAYLPDTAFTYKTDHNGNALWIKGFKGNEGSNSLRTNRCRKVMIDSLNNYYVLNLVSDSVPGLYGHQFKTWMELYKYDVAGTPGWYTRLPYINSADIIDACEWSGTLDVFGRSAVAPTSTTRDFLYFNTDENTGTVNWIKSYSCPRAAYSAFGKTMVENSTGEIITASFYGVYPTTGTLISKYAVGLTKMWTTNIYDSLTVIDTIVDLKLDAHDNIYVLINRNFYGVTATTAATNQYRTILAKLDNNGIIVWKKVIDVTGVNPSAAVSLAVSDSGTAYIAVNAGTSSMNHSILKYDRNGNQVWSNTANPTLFTNTYITRLNTDTHENVYACGYAGNGTVSTAKLMAFKIDSAGNAKWNAVFADTLSLTQMYNDAVLYNGKYFMTGVYGRKYCIITALDTASGSGGWSDLYAASNKSYGKKILGKGGSIYVMGSEEKNAAPNYVGKIFLLKYDVGGSQYWATSYTNQNSDWLHYNNYGDFTVDNNAHAILTTGVYYSSNQNLDAEVITYSDNSGAQLSDIKYAYTVSIPACPASTSAHDMVNRIMTTTAGEILLLGYASTYQQICNNVNGYPEILFMSFSTSYSPVAIEESAENSGGLLLYPNPGRGKFHVKGFNSDEKTITVEVMDLMGRQIEKMRPKVENGIAELNLQLSSGVYFFRVMHGPGLKQVSKVIITE